MIGFFSAPQYFFVKLYHDEHIVFPVGLAMFIYIIR